MPKLTVIASAIPEGKTTVSIYVSAINELGGGVTGYKKENFNITILHPDFSDLTGALKKPHPGLVVGLETSSVKDLGDGFYKVICETTVALPSGRFVFSLTMNKPFAKSKVLGRGQTLVTFDV